LGGGFSDDRPQFLELALNGFGKRLNVLIHCGRVSALHLAKAPFLRECLQCTCVNCGPSMAR
jgi:hypothetical protein